MWISSFSIRNPVVTIVSMLSLVVFGAISLATLETDEFPEVNPPVISVSIPYPGASPEVVEREVVKPLEEAFESINGVDETMSTATDGFAQLIIIFLFDKDLQEASQDIRDKISERMRDLPREMEEPVLTRFDPQDLPIVSLTLSSADIDVAHLTRIADPGLVGELRGLPGVADVVVVGGAVRELSVEVDPDALSAAGISIAQVVAALEQQNLAAPVGRVQSDTEERTIRLLGRMETPQDFDQLVVAATGDRLIRLGDVATVKDGTEEQRSVALFNDEQAVGIDIKKTTSSSTTAVSAGIREKLAQLERQLPKGVKLTVVRDAGERVAGSVHDVQRTLVEGALLTVLVVFVFLASWRSTVITGLALPVSVLASFVIVKAFGFTLNTMSLLGLSLAIGILVDDAIVVRENIVRHMEMGKDHVRAAHEGTAEIGLAVAATTFAIVVVFVPVAFMGGIAEQWFAPFALTIAASVLVSLFVSFSLDPMLSSVWPDPEAEGGRRTWIGERLHGLNRWLDRGTARYELFIGWALRHRKTMLFIAVVAFVGALAIPGTGLIGSSFFPREDRSEFFLRLETPPGSSLEYTRAKALLVERIARAQPEVDYTYSTIGSQTQLVDEASIYVHLVPSRTRKRTQQEVEAEVRERSRRLAGVTTTLQAGGLFVGKQIQVQLTGPDLAVLNRFAAQLEREARMVPGAVDVGLSTRGQSPELVVEVDRELAATMGVTVNAVALALRPAFASIDAGDWVDPSGETRDVTVRLAPSARTRAADLARLPLVVPIAFGDTVPLPGQPTTTVVPLGQVARIERGLGPAQVQHYNGERVVTVGANTEDAPLSQVVAAIEAKAHALALPPGYAIVQGGETKSQREVFGRIATSLMIALMLMYMILVVQFRSFLDPLPILASLPLSLIGVMLALLITGSTLNLMSLIGVILLMGIVAKNAILLVDFAKRAESDGLDRDTAIIRAGAKRLRPILMTSVAIIAGMLPVALGHGEGGDFRAPLGRAVIGGVITSTLLTLLVIPTAYDVLATWRENMSRRLRRFARARREAPAQTAAS